MKTNKLFILFLILVFLLSGIVYADDIDLEIDSSIETISPQDTIPSINSRAAIVYDRNSGMILYGKNENEKRKMASTTKILTAIITIENSTLSDIVTISSKSAGTGGSRLGLHKDDKISVADLLYGLMLCSGNDAAVALAEHISGSVENFAILMNQKACKIGLNSSHFVTPHGLDNEEHYTTAYELALLTNYALKNDIFRKYVGTKSQTITINTYSKTLNNTNELLGYLDGVYGVKTGFTNGANRCLVTAVKRNNMDLICIVLGADTKKDRTRDSIELIEYAFKTFVPETDFRVSSLFIKEGVLKGQQVKASFSFSLKGIVNRGSFVYFERLPVGFHPVLMQYELADFAFTDWTLQAATQMVNLYQLEEEGKIVQLF